MSFISEIEEAEASGPAAACYAAASKQYGEIYNLHRARVRLPELAEHFEATTAAPRDRMGLRRYELVTLAAALALRSSHCALAHGWVLLNNDTTPEELERIRTGRGHTWIAPQEAD